MKRLASLMFLIDSIAIGLGGFGHGLAVRHVHAAIDRFPIEGDIHSMIYVVWYFVSGCMFLFGATLVWVWSQLRTGDDRPLVVAVFIGTLYVVIGAFGFVYRSGDPFMVTFLVLGGLLLPSGYALRRPSRRAESNPFVHS